MPFSLFLRKKSSLADITTRVLLIVLLYCIS
jgi:hypothetical protein